MKRWTLIALLALLGFSAYAFPTNESTAYVNITEVEGDWNSFNFKWTGMTDQRVLMNVSNDSGIIDMTGYKPNFRVSKDGTVYIDVPYSVGATTNININGSVIDFFVSRTNIPPDAGYKAELWVYEGATTNLANTFAQGKIAVSRSLYEDTNSFPFPATPTNFADYLTIDTAAATYATKAESYTNFVMVESISNYVSFAPNTLTIGIDTNVQAGDITSVNVTGGFLTGGTNTGDAVITLTTNSIDGTFASDTELTQATGSLYTAITAEYTAADIVATNAAVTTANAYTDSTTNSMDLAGVMKAGNIASTNLNMNGFTIGDTQGEGIYVSSTNGGVGINTREPATLPTFSTTAELTVQASGLGDTAVIIKDSTATSATKSLAWWDTGDTNIWSLEMESAASDSLEFWYYIGADAAWVKMLEFSTNGTMTGVQNFAVDGDTTLNDVTTGDAAITGNAVITSNTYVYGHVRGDGATDITGIDDFTANDGAFSNSIQQGGIDVVLETRRVLGGTGIDVSDNGFLSNNVTVSLDTDYADARYIQSVTNAFTELIVADNEVTGADIVSNGSFTNGLVDWASANFTWNAAQSNVTVLSGNTGTLSPSNSLAIREDGIYKVSWVATVDDSFESITTVLGAYTNVYTREEASGALTFTNTMSIPARSTDNLLITAVATSNNITMDDIEVSEILKGDVWAYKGHFANEITVGGTNVLSFIGLSPIDARPATNSVNMNGYSITGIGTNSIVFENGKAMSVNLTTVFYDSNAMAMQSGVDGLGTTQATHSAAITANDADIAALVVTQASHTVSIAGLDAETSGLYSTQATHTASIAANGADITALFTTQAVDTASIAVNAGDIAALTSTQSTLTASIAGNDADIAGLYSTQATHTASIAGNSADVSALFSTQATHTASIAANSADISGLFTTQATHTASIADTGADVTALFSTQATHTASISVTETDINALTSTQGVQQASIDALLSTQATQQVSIDNFTSPVIAVVRGATSFTAITDNTIQIIAYANEIKDTHAAFAGNQFTAPRTDDYRVSVLAPVNANNSGANVVVVSVLVNGVVQASGIATIQAEGGVSIMYNAANVDVVLPLTLNDVVRVEVKGLGPGDGYNLVGAGLSDAAAIWQLISINSL